MDTASAHVALASVTAPPPLVGDYLTSLDWSLIAISCLALTLQLYLLYLIVMVSSKAMHNYRYFLLQNCCWDVAFTVLFGFALMPDLMYPTSCAVVNGPLRVFGRLGGAVGFSAIVASVVCVKLSQVWIRLYRVSQKFVASMC